MFRLKASISATLISLGLSQDISRVLTQKEKEYHSLTNKNPFLVCSVIFHQSNYQVQHCLAYNITGSAVHFVCDLLIYF